MRRQKSYEGMPESFQCLIQDNTVFYRYSFLLAAALTFDIIIRFVVILLKKIPIISAFSGAFVPVLFLILIGINWNCYLKYRITRHDILFLLVFYLYAALTYILNPETRYYISSYISNIVFVFPLYYLLGVSFLSDGRTKDILVLTGKIVIVVDLLYVFYVSKSGQILAEDSMERAYRMAPFVMYFIIRAIDKRKAVDIFWAVFSGMYLLTCGNRGSIVVLVGFLLYCMFIRDKRFTIKKFFCFVIIIGVFIFSQTGYFLSLIMKITRALNGIGFSTRVFDEFVAGTFISNNNGRTRFYDIFYEMIRQNPFGYGMFGEWARAGWSIHNLYLQFIIHFGVFLGPTLIISIFLIVYQSFHFSPNPHARDFIAVWACYVFLRGLVGGAYIDWDFALLLGLCVGEMRRIKRVYPYMEGVKQYESERSA